MLNAKPLSQVALDVLELFSYEFIGTSQGIAAWKLGLAVGLPVISVTGLIIIGIYIKLKTAAKLAAAAKGGSADFQQVVSNPTTPTIETQI